jgi:hypothetical protein
VFVTWLRSELDAPEHRAITGYRVWRRVPPPGGQGGSAVNLAAGIPHVAVREVRRVTPGGTVETTFWEPLATLPAEFLEGYGYTAPTTQDSMPGSNPYTAFFVTALTADPFTFYESNVDSGYSVDNLAPEEPSPFVGVYNRGAGVALHWGPSRAPDLAIYHLHRGTSPGFVPSPGNLLVAKRDTGYVDGAGTTAHYYKLAAVDGHGNRGPFALVSPLGPTGTVLSLVSADVDIGTVELTWYGSAGSGFTAILYRREDTGSWERLAVLVADGGGLLQYVDRGVPPGWYGYCLGFAGERGEEFGGEVWVTVPGPRLALRGAMPNPAVDILTVSVVLESGEPATLELLDLGGRRVLAREVGQLGYGSHSVTLAGARALAPGVYIVRITQSGRSATAKVSVLR